MDFITYSNNLAGNLNGNEKRALLKGLKPYFPLFGEKKMQDITRHDIQRANSLFSKAKVKNKTINYRIWALRIVFSIASKEGTVERNIISSVSNLKKNIFNKQVLTDDEIRKIIINKDKTLYGNAYCLSLFTGIHQRYLLACNWSDVDFKTKKLRISKRLHFDKRKNIRPIAIPIEMSFNYLINDLTIKILQDELKRQCNILKLSIDEIEGSERPLYINGNNDRASIDNFRDVYKRYALKIGIKYTTSDCLSYTYGVIALDADALFQMY